MIATLNLMVNFSDLLLVGGRAWPSAGAHVSGPGAARWIF